MKTRSLMIVTLMLFAPNSGYAAEDLNGPGDQFRAKIAVHLEPHQTKGQCQSVAAQNTWCSDLANSNLQVEGSVGVAYDAFHIILDSYPEAGITGASFGISYGQDLGAFGWTNCGDLDFPGGGWPASGGGTAITFANCQDDVSPNDPEGHSTVVLGAMYLYAYGNADYVITKRNYVVVPDLKVADCDGAETDLWQPYYVGSLGFGTAEGFNPCVGIIDAVERTSWSELKLQYSSSN